MQSYEASQTLVDILLKNGFSDATNRYYPDHFNGLQRIPYNPNAFKRVFKFHSQRDNITFDYINIHAYVNGGACGSSTKLSEDEVKSLIAFYKMPVYFRRKWARSSKSVWHFHEEYKKICANPEWYTRVIDKKLKETFEAVVL
jgi:hypothetical protein